MMTQINDACMHHLAWMSQTFKNIFVHFGILKNEHIYQILPLNIWRASIMQQQQNAGLVYTITL